MSEEPKEYSEKEQWEDDLDVAPLNYVKPKSKKPILEKAEFDQKKKSLWIPILSILGILTIGSIILFIKKEQIWNTSKMQLGQKAIINTDNSKNESNKKSEEENIEFIENEPLTNQYIKDNMMIDTSENETHNETYLINIEPELDEDPKNFHIVIGSFEQEKNAHLFASNRESLSENIRIVEFNGFYRVSYDSYFDNFEAKTALNNIRNSLNILAWIAYMK